MPSSMEMIELYDNALLGILQHVGNIHNFLEVYFGFLYRKTDFYRLLSTPNDRMGFSPGVAEKMVLNELEVQATKQPVEPRGVRTEPAAQREFCLGFWRAQRSLYGQVVHQASPDSCNEAVRDAYSWSQDYTYVEVRVNIPKTVVKGRQGAPFKGQQFDPSLFDIPTSAVKM
nr:nudC domain-containing protein 3-like [Oncorhynchus nerka]